ncbi:response regulator [Paucibacter sp. PLA-PC-4]|uniref:response regulator n=1 Tax=Paucibacter sp. PLA-PC-4 TaxID=2993655 RepID=UPI00224ABEDB|nr:response regulator [Paucibacter sp. PLA-PC-4]MCX2864875.1 response regulator [Paucibacter sp. PLA-PC-4]
MKLLLIEDDKPKQNQILDLLSSEMLQIDHAASINEAIRYLDDGVYDCILLDMSLPTFDASVSGGRQQDLGGRQILTYMWEMEIPSRVMLVTQLRGFRNLNGDETSLAELDMQLRQEFPGLYAGYTHFHHSTGAWMTAITGFIKSND